MAQFTEMVKPGAGLVNVAKRDVQKRLDEGWTIYADRNKKPEARTESPTTILDPDEDEEDPGEWPEGEEEE